MGSIYYSIWRYCGASARCQWCLNRTAKSLGVGGKRLEMLGDDVVWQGSRTRINDDAYGAGVLSTDMRTDLWVLACPCIGNYKYGVVVQNDRIDIQVKKRLILMWSSAILIPPIREPSKSFPHLKFAKLKISNSIPPNLTQTVRILPP